MQKTAGNVDVLKPRNYILKEKNPSFIGLKSHDFWILESGNIPMFSKGKKLKKITWNFLSPTKVILF